MRVALYNITTRRSIRLFARDLPSTEAAEPVNVRRNGNVTLSRRSTTLRKGVTGDVSDTDGCRGQGDREGEEGGYERAGDVSFAMSAT